MVNPISVNLKTGAIGELLVRLRLLQWDIQSFKPDIDTGNDLIAMKGRNVSAFQIKTSTGDSYQVVFQKLHDYDYLALVELKGAGSQIFLDRSKIFLFEKDQVEKEKRKGGDSKTYNFNEIQAWELNLGTANRLLKRLIS